MNQNTITEKVSCTGTGLHTGVPVQLSVYPARAGTGIVFVRTDLGDPVEIPARVARVVSSSFSTSLGRAGVTLSTVEHLLAAFYALGIDNARVEVDAAELPAMDGSAAPFVFLLRSAGLFAQREPRTTLRVKRAVSLREGARRISIEPAPCLRLSYAVDYEHPKIRRQSLEVSSVTADYFERELAAARTFGFLREVEELWVRGLAHGGSLKNAVVLDEEGVLNPEGLRFEDEFVRHKALDLLGDLALLGTALRGHVRVERGGHALHHQLVRALLAEPAAWEILGPEAAAPHWFASAALP
ncbi:MAG: UDP-3-O-acyl-N-acetylglucosamine deacetylase [Myxococcales bacterium]|nr:UDP-3-O-acyl-N-acetylglucosamine deacetylase [Myxococcales bacterium]